MEFFPTDNSQQIILILTNFCHSQTQLKENNKDSSTVYRMQIFIEADFTLLNAKILGVVTFMQ